MLTNVLGWIVGKEPVATATGLAGGVAALLGVLAAYDVYRPTPEQLAAIVTLVTWLAGWLARQAVTPMAKLGLSPGDKLPVGLMARRDPPPERDPLDTVEGDSRIDGL